MGDIFADVFLFAKSFAFMEGPAFRSWLNILAQNRIRKAIRSYRKRPIPLSDQTIPAGDGGKNSPL
ncbi:MAG: hypothetical protein KJ645_10620, partial [Planctomycetes bacterium]|nr:hypothetical protein [Planctomycetota bacterium]